ncbi:MAG TPA: coproporphyrinogen-III oxidase family protein, partial [Rhodanobacteraceae bacterium]
DAKLRALGRVHSAAEAESAVKLAQDAGFGNINLDLMYALPQQSAEGALADVERAIALAPAHISHYQLTLEPNTAFAADPPPLPDEDAAWTMQEACQTRLAQAGFAQYEVSAYAREGRRCVHNLNYWTFGDYLGIGAGAHGKVTGPGTRNSELGKARLDIRRRWKVKHPRAYLENANTEARIGGDSQVPPAELPFEYMLNALRLVDGTALEEFPERTGLALDVIETPLRDARARAWLEGDRHILRATELGRRFLNDVIAGFMPG